MNTLTFKKAERSQVFIKPKRNRKMTTSQRIFRMSVATDSGCWEWIGSIMKSGYGCLGVNGKTEFAHRASFREFNGPIPVGLDVCHKCDNRKCVKPGHLFTGTRKQNMQDCVSKGRQNRKGSGLRGEQVLNSILTTQSVIEIKLALKSGNSCTDIAPKFGVSRSTISKIKSNKTWKHVIQ